MKRWAAGTSRRCLASACGAPAPPCGSIHARWRIRSPASPEHFIIAAVDNDPSAFVARAGRHAARLRQPSPSYGPSVSAARRTMRSLERDYGLREVSAWPIEPLHMHCAVLEVPTAPTANAAGGPRARRRDQAGAAAAELCHAHGRLQRPVCGTAARVPANGCGRCAILGRAAKASKWRSSTPACRYATPGLARQYRGRRQFRRFRRSAIPARPSRHGDGGRNRGGCQQSRRHRRDRPRSARLLLFKACWQTRLDADAAHCNSFTLARALVAAFDAHAQIINLSLAGPADPLLSDLIREGVHRGILFVGAAAGETSGEGLLHQPGVIEVASAGNPSVLDSAVYAPGREILTLLPGGHYDFASGDSVATAEVSGVLALLLAKKAGLTATDAYRLLHDSSAHPGGESTGVDACAAIISLVGKGSCNPTSQAGQKGAGAPERRLALH